MATVPAPVEMEEQPLTIDIHSAMEPVETDWRRLERQPFISVHQSFDWCRSWLVHTGGPPLIVSVRDGDGVRMILPLEIISRFGTRCARFIGNPFSNLNTGLYTEELPTRFKAEALERIGAALRQKAPDLHLVILEKMPCEWRGVENPLLQIAHIESQNRAFQTSLHPSFDAVLSQINGKKRRKKFRYIQRRLEEAGGYAVVHGDTETVATDLLETFYVQKARRFEKQAKLDVFASPAIQAFFKDLVTRPRDRDDWNFRLSALQLHDGRIAAIAGVSFKAGHFICQFGSIDEEIGGTLSVGEFLFYRLIEESCGPDAVFFDFGIGDEPYKHSWCDTKTVHYDAYLPLSARGRLMAAAMKAMTQAKSVIKSHPTLDRAARGLQRRFSA